MFKEKIRTKDIKAIVLFILAWPIALIMKKRHNNVWLFSERPREARDNGYWLYQYTKKNHSDQEAYYVITSDSPDRKRLSDYGGIILYGSFKHYLIYLLAECHVSAHVDLDSPNSRVSNFLERHNLLKNKRVFLQHGITKDKISFGYYSVSRADLFVCAAKPEYEFCKREFGYPEGTVRLLGFARFDGLGVGDVKRQILLMPTWRAWLAGVSEQIFVESEYFKMYQSLITNEELKKLLKKENTQLVFCPHSDMQKFISLFDTSSSDIVIATEKKCDIQRLMNESAMLITDYSSVAFDVAYMDKPVCYYQFDYNEYRKRQHPEGYYSYEENGFGPICKSEDELFEVIKAIIHNNFETEQKYKQRQEEFFTVRDRNNCKRIYEAIKELNDARTD